MTLMKRAPVLLLLLVLVAACTSAREVKSGGGVDFSSLTTQATEVHDAWATAWKERRISRESALRFDAWWKTFQRRHLALERRIDLATTENLPAIRDDIAALHADLARWAVPADGERL